MLVYGIKLSVFVVFAISLSVFFFRDIFFRGVGRKIAIFWLGMVPFVFWLQNELISLMFPFLFLFFLNKNNSHIISVVLFIVVLSAVPDWLQHVVSAPGINYLMLLTYDKVAVAVLLLPIFFNLGSFTHVQWNLTDTLVSLFVVLMILLTFREGKLTSVMRFSVEVVLMYVVPYFVVSRVVRSVSDLHYCSLAFLMLAILLTAVYMVSQAIQIDIYEALNLRSQYNGIREYRGGFLRISGPLIGILVGFLLLAGYFSLDILKKFKLVKGTFYWVLIVAFIFALLFTGSRGALLGVIIGVAVYWYFVKLSGTKRFLIVAMVGILLVAEYAFDLSAYLVYEDEYGTFDYRSELYETSLQFLSVYPLFGSQFYIESGYFDHLVTGLGIIDIVSAYLQVALKYGYVGLLLFVGMYLSVIIPLLSRLLSMSDMNDDVFKYTAMYFSLNLTAMVMISTTSIVSFFPVYIIVMLAIGRVLLSDIERN